MAYKDSRLYNTWLQCEYGKIIYVLSMWCLFKNTHTHDMRGTHTRHMHGTHTQHMHGTHTKSKTVYTCSCCILPNKHDYWVPIIHWYTCHHKYGFTTVLFYIYCGLEWLQFMHVYAEWCDGLIWGQNVCVLILQVYSNLLIHTMIQYLLTTTANPWKTFCGIHNVQNLALVLVIVRGPGPLLKSKLQWNIMVYIGAVKFNISSSLAWLSRTSYLEEQTQICNF